MKTYIATYPQNFGLPKTFKLLFKQTDKGYCAKVAVDKWIGMPKDLIERNNKLFKYVGNKTNVGRNRIPTQNETR